MAARDDDDHVARQARPANLESNRKDDCGSAGVRQSIAARITWREIRGCAAQLDGIATK
jgi:hypothetical protein